MKKFFLLAVLASGLNAYAVDLLNFGTVVDLNEYKGTPYFEVMRKQIKPGLDAYATEGFIVANSATLKKQIKHVSSKVSGKLGTSSSVLKLADKLNASKTKVTFYDLQSNPTISAIDRFGLPPVISLLSGGGVAVKINEDAYAYNVCYGTGDVKDDEMTGRSYGAVNGVHKADDASDKAYLQALEKIAKPKKQLQPQLEAAGEKFPDIAYFTRGILELVISSDSSNFTKMSPAAQAVASDFLAVYTAEQDRHLMANLQSHHWDSALLEVTLLANFHAGQKKIKIMYESSEDVFEFTDTVTNQQKVTDTKPKKKRQAGLHDYWQFSKNPNNPGRSGINITRPAFSKLEYKISDYERANHPEKVEAIESLLTGVKTGGNVFKEVSDFLINYKTQKDVQLVGKDLVKAYTAFLNQVREDANAITDQITVSMKQ